MFLAITDRGTCKAKQLLESMESARKRKEKKQGEVYAGKSTGESLHVQGKKLLT